MEQDEKATCCTPEMEKESTGQSDATSSERPVLASGRPHCKMNPIPPPGPGGSQGHDSGSHQAQPPGDDDDEEAAGGVGCWGEAPASSAVLTESLGSVQLRNQMRSDPWHRGQHEGPVTTSEDLWVVVKGLPVVQPSREGQEEDAVPQDGPSPSGETYVAVDHEDVVDAVAEFVKGRIERQLGNQSFDPSEVTTAVSLAFSEEKGARWRRIWGNGRLLYRSASAAGGLAKGCQVELGPEGRTGQVLRSASSKAMSVLRISPSADGGK